jgi:hypothetical protein
VIVGESQENSALAEHERPITSDPLERGAPNNTAPEQLGLEIDWERLPFSPAEPLHGAVDPIVIRIVRALARQAAREDHARETRK